MPPSGLGRPKANRRRGVRGLRCLPLLPPPHHDRCGRRSGDWARRGGPSSALHRGRPPALAPGGRDRAHPIPSAGTGKHLAPQGGYLWEESAALFRLGHTADSEGEGCETATELKLLLLGVDRGFCAAENAEKFLDNLVAAPVVVLKVLEPLEVRHDHPARIAQDIRDQLDIAALRDDLVRRVRGRTVGSFSQDAALEFWRILIGNHSLKRGGYKDRAFQFEQLLVRYCFSSIEVHQGFRCRNVCEGFLEVDPARVENPSGVV